MTERKPMPSKIRDEAAINARLAKQRKKPLPKRTDDGPKCPRCGGSQFKKRRSKSGRRGVIATGLIGLAFTRQNSVECEACGMLMERG